MFSRGLTRYTCEIIGGLDHKLCLRHPRANSSGEQVCRHPTVCPRSIVHFDLVILKFLTKILDWARLLGHSVPS